MYAVVATGGKQYRVEPGAELLVERLPGESGSTVTFDRVLLVADGDAVTVGTPTVAGASVSGTVLGEALGPKLIIFKFKQKVKYRRRTGHRQHLTRVRIDEISAGGSRSKSSKAAAEPQATADAKAADGAADATPEKPKRTRRTAAASGAAKEKANAAPRADAGKAEDKPAPRRRRAAKQDAEE
jgi:large subunit ribosomal protein L21